MNSCKCSCQLAVWQKKRNSNYICWLFLLCYDLHNLPLGSRSFTLKCRHQQPNWHPWEGVNQTKPFLLSNFPPIQVKMTTQNKTAANAVCLLFRGHQRAILLKYQLHKLVGRQDVSVLSAFVGSGLICSMCLSRHLLDSISLRVTSADYISSKQAAT